VVADELETPSIAPPASIEPPPADVLLRASLPPYRLGAILLRIAELKLTGQLALSSDMGRRTIYFHSGFPVFSESSLFGERLGAIGVRHGLLTKEAVARALSHARERSCGLGQALLELGRVDAAGLFALLGVQLREVVAASCGSEPLRARFLSGHAALRNVVILRLHPLTAVLTTVMALPSKEQTQLLEAVGSRRVLGASLPLPAQQWLADLGYLGELERLCAGEPTVNVLRTRLAARHRSGSERYFDPAEVAFALPASRNDAQPWTPAKVADLATLSLLLAGGLTLGESASPIKAAPVSESGPPTTSLQLSLEEAAARPLSEVRAPASTSESETEKAIESYLYSARERALAAASAVFGPSVEARDAALSPDLMKLYLSLKPEKRPEVVLEVGASASPDQITQAYARKVELLSSLGKPDATPHLRCRAAELAQCLEDALDKLSPSNGRAREAHALRPALDEELADALPASEPPVDAPVSPMPLASQPPPRADFDALSGRVEALMRAGNWRGVLDTLEAQPSSPALPFTLRLALAMAHRELEGRTARSSRRAWIVAFVIGFSLGAALHYFAGPSLQALLRP
jgi:hypothetical protein